ncbi:MAG: hypothetical protein ACOYNC_15535 [Bacteroidales bacterium]
MLQALLHSKISRWLTKSPWEIEDLLTSVVFGSCQYAGLDGWRLVLHPFLSSAYQKVNSQQKITLEHRLPPVEQITAIDYEFWPSFKSFSSELNIDPSANESNESKLVNIARAEPEVILKISTKTKKYIIAIEVKLNIGKSSGPSADVLGITDQLAKYWYQLENYAFQNEYISLGVVYITQNVEYPEDAIEESCHELSSKTGVYPAIFWTSWRKIVRLVESNMNNSGTTLPLILQDMIKLIGYDWGFYYEDIKPWPNKNSVSLVTDYLQCFSFSTLNIRSFDHQYQERFSWSRLAPVSLNWQFL